MTWLDNLRGIIPQTSPDEEGQSIVRSFLGGVGPWVWIKQRNWIKPSVDPTGAVDATAEINRCMLVRKGACVSLPDGIMRINGSLATQPHGSLVGAQHGHGISSEFSDYPNRGTRIRAYGTGRLITMAVDSTVDGMEIYYPGQQTNATPTVFGETIYVPADAHITTIQNLALVNSYVGIRVGQLTTPYAANGCRIDNIIGYPLSRGIVMGRNADVVRATNVHFKNFSSLAGSTLLAWVQANGQAFVVDGAEEANLENCFAYGYLVGLQFEDVDGDAFRGVYGSFRGGGFDQCKYCINVTPNNMLTARGFKVSDCSLVPLSNGTGVGVFFQDTHVPTQFDHRPALFLSNVSFSGSTHDTGVFALPGSYGLCYVSGGSMQQFVNQGAINQSANAKLYLDHVMMPTGATRTVNSGGGTLSDTNPITV